MNAQADDGLKVIMKQSKNNVATYQYVRYVITSCVYFGKIYTHSDDVNMTSQFIAVSPLACHDDPEIWNLSAVICDYSARQWESI